MSREPDGWRSSGRRRDDGAIDSEQRVLATRPVVERSDGGARLLGRRYWLEVSRASRGLVRRRESADAVELLLLGFGPPLLTLGPAQIEVDRERVSCSYPIRGGLLVRRAGGTLSLAQTGLERPELCVAVNGFFPRPSFLYEPVQRRFHAFVSRRYFRRLVAEGQQ